MEKYPVPEKNSSDQAEKYQVTGDEQHRTVERYLTARSLPNRKVQWLEKIYLALLFLPMAACAYVAYHYYMLYERLHTQHIYLLAAILLIGLAMTPVAERLRARLHARKIVRALVKSPEGGVHVDDLDAASGFTASARTLQSLLEKGYVQDVAIANGTAWLTDCMPETAVQKTEVKQLFHDKEI